MTAVSLCEEARNDAPDLESARHVAFECYVLPHVDMLYRVARTMTKKPQDAEDLVQETLLRAFRAVDRFDGRYPKAWLTTILRNEAINRTRRGKNELLRDGDEALEGLMADSDLSIAVEDRAIARSFDAELAAAFDSLPEQYRVVAVMVDVEDMSYQEAAEALDVPVGTIMSRLHRARKKLRQHLASAGADLVGATA